VIPVSSTRWLVCQRDRVTLRESTSVRWSTSIAGPSDRVTDGAILFDGRSVALIAENRAETVRHLVVLGMHEPIVQHRMQLAGVDALRFAKLRGFALLYADKRLLVVDLRFGRVVKEHDLDGELADLAIDDSALHVALRYRNQDEVALLAVSTLLTTRSRREADLAAPTIVAPAKAPSEDPHPPAEEQPPAEGPSIALGSVAALAPRATVVATT